MEKYLKTVREMYAWFKKINAHPLEKCIGRHAAYRGRVLEVVGYSGSCSLIVDASKCGGWKKEISLGLSAVFRGVTASHAPLVCPTLSGMEFH